MPMIKESDPQEAVPLLAKTRHEMILQMLKEQKNLSITEVAEKLNVSEITARRDLEFLESTTKMLVRIRGGAQLAEPDLEDLRETKTTYLNERFMQRISKNMDLKSSIGKLAASLVREDETIVIDAGSTTLQLAKHLPDDTRMTAIVTAINIAEELENKSKITKVLTGGVYRSRTTTLLSPFIEESLTSIYADRVFIGVSGVSLTHGVTDNDILEKDVKKVLLKSGREIYWLADSSKLDNIGTFLVSPLLESHTVITDSGITDEMRRKLESKCRVLVAEKE